MPQTETMRMARPPFGRRAGQGWRCVCQPWCGELMRSVAVKRCVFTACFLAIAACSRPSAAPCEGPACDCTPGSEWTGTACVDIDE
jgi:hypothetical protein